MSKNLKAFLDMIAVSELGYKLLNNSDDGYNVLVGGTLFDNGYATHPNILVPIPSLGINSTAAGRYQILYRNYVAYSKQLGLHDFSPASQNAIAVQMIKERKALPLIEDGNITEAIVKVSNIWASLPGAGYDQHENKLADLLKAYTDSNGTLAA
jgi:muramidase (phage lysozyme)